MAWTDERIAILKRGWEGGKTATQIAEELGEGVTRNAVIGKAHRLGLESRPSPVKNSDEAPAKPAPKAAAPAAPEAPPPSPRAEPRVVEARSPEPAAPAPAPVRTKPVGKAKGARTTLLDLNDKVCKWPIGHPGEPDFHFCGKPSQAGFPYCTEHCLVAYQAQMPRRDRSRPLPPLSPGAPPRR
jgi:GcrA cell cycle regulator